MPRIDDILDELGQAKYITTLDLAKGYWQVAVTPQDQEKTAFSSPLGLFQFKRMPFGLSGAPGTFQRLMDRVINGLSLTKAYLNDLVIYSSTWQEHLSHVEQIFLRLKKAGLTIKLKICQLAMEECTYLGHVIGKGTSRPELSKLKAVEIYPVPTT